MKLGLASVIFSIFLACRGVSATAEPSTDRMMGDTRGFAAGAAYFITNEPDGNFIVAADIGADGQLTLRRAVDAEGLGAHGLTDPISTDPLFSQGSVKVSNEANLLVTVNSGSNTLSAFKIDPHNPTNLTMIGKPTSSGGQFPISVAFNKAGDMLCALNSGAINGVSCYSVDQQRGLMPLPNTVRSLGLNQTTPATGPAGTASHIIFTEDEQQLVAAVKGTPPQPGFFAVWDIQNSSLSENFKSIAPAQGGALPFSMTIIPNKNAVLASDAAIGFDIVDLADVSESQTNRSSANKIEGQKAICWSSFSSSTGNYYLTDTAASIVTEVSVDDNLKPTVVNQYPLNPVASILDLDIATVANKDFMYVLSANLTAVNVLSLDGPGQATNIQQLDFSGPASRAGLAINANNLQGMTVYQTVQ